MEQNIIRPIVGRQIWFWPQHGRDFAVLDHRQPCMAEVVFVHNDRLVNLVVTDHLGRSKAFPNAQLVQPGDEIPDHPHATWMDFHVRSLQLQHATLAPQEPVPVTEEGTLLPISGEALSAASSAAMTDASFITSLQSTGDHTEATDPMIGTTNETGPAGTEGDLPPKD